MENFGQDQFDRGHEANKLVALFSSINLPIRMKILAAFLVIIIAMGSLNVLLVIQTMFYQQQYDSIMNNISAANNLTGFSYSISAEMWRIVFGKVQFSEGRQYEIIRDVKQQVQQMIENTDSPRARTKLRVILLTLDTLAGKVDNIGSLIVKGEKTDVVQRNLDDVLWVAGLVEDNVQDYMLFEILRSEDQYRQIQDNFTQWVITSVIVLGVAGAFSVLAAWAISESIYIPIKKLHDVTRTITSQDLEVLLSGEHVDEITEMGMSFNIMVRQINHLLESKVAEQKNLKKAELRTLQAQITPHFLYNTFDTIIWLVEAGRNAQAIEIVRALSDFFRIGLSKGKDWISIREEIKHTQSYLTIQQIRYHDILEFKIDVDEDIMDYTILKLTLQPLVENALYHGIKGSRKGGIITVTGRKQDDKTLLLEIHDNGIGFTAKRLAEIREEMENETHEIVIKESGFGLDNVNRRNRLYYGKDFGLQIESRYRHGTCVMLTIPIINDGNIPA